MIANPMGRVSFRRIAIRRYGPTFFFLYELQIIGYQKGPVRYPVLSGGACRD